jgi:hypothetical protein
MEHNLTWRWAAGLTLTSSGMTSPVFVEAFWMASVGEVANHDAINDAK